MGAKARCATCTSAGDEEAFKGEAKAFGDKWRFWSLYDEIADAYDRDLMSRLNTGLDNLLIFVSRAVSDYSESDQVSSQAGLFSAVDSAFLVLTISNLSPGTSDQTNALLTQTNALLAQLVLGINATYTPVDVAASFHTAPGVIRQNCFFFASLFTSLLAAAGALLAKQWLAYYEYTGQTGPLDEQGLRRTEKYLGAEKWRLQLAVEALPTLILLSLALFFGGMIDYCWGLNLWVAGVVTGLAGLGNILYTAMLLAAALSTSCPFQTPPSRLIAPYAGRFFYDGLLPLAIHIFDLLIKLSKQIRRCYGWKAREEAASRIEALRDVICERRRFWERHVEKRGIIEYDPARRELLCVESAAFAVHVAPRRDLYHSLASNLPALVDLNNFTRLATEDTMNTAMSGLQEVLAMKTFDTDDRAWTFIRFLLLTHLALPTHKDHIQKTNWSLLIPYAREMQNKERQLLLTGLLRAYGELPRDEKSRFTLERQVFAEDLQISRPTARLYLWILYRHWDKETFWDISCLDWIISNTQVISDDTLLIVMGAMLIVGLQWQSNHRESLYAAPYMRFATIEDGLPRSHVDVKHVVRDLLQALRFCRSRNPEPSTQLRRFAVTTIKWASRFRRLHQEDETSDWSQSIRDTLRIQTLAFATLNTLGDDETQLATLNADAHWAMQSPFYPTIGRTDQTYHRFSAPNALGPIFLSTCAEAIESSVPQLVSSFAFQPNISQLPELNLWALVTVVELLHTKSFTGTKELLGRIVEARQHVSFWEDGPYEDRARILYGSLYVAAWRSIKQSSLGFSTAEMQIIIDLLEAISASLELDGKLCVTIPVSSNPYMASSTIRPAQIIRLNINLNAIFMVTNAAVVRGPIVDPLQIHLRTACKAIFVKYPETTLYEGAKAVMEFYADRAEATQGGSREEDPASTRKISMEVDEPWSDDMGEAMSGSESAKQVLEGKVDDEEIFEDPLSTLAWGGLASGSSR